MPELPEVENIRRGLSVIEGQTIRNVFVLQPKTISGKGNARTASARKVNEFVDELKKETVKSVERRGKNLLIRMKSGKLILAHLKMSGQFLYDPAREMEIGKHTRVFFELSSGNLLFNDVRRFGYVLYLPNQRALHESGHFENLGIEPFDRKFTPKYLAEMFAGKRGTVKAALMGQEIVAGLGNIYADEVCFRAGIRPSRKIDSLGKEEIKKLHKAIKEILRSAVKYGGSSIKSYRKADGTEGTYSSRHFVYGRAGKRCFVCNEILSKTIMGSRTTVFCSSCQK